MVDRMPEMTNYLPDLKKYLLDYPKVTLPNAESFLYWQNVKFGLKPTIRINHLTIADQQSHVAVVSKMLYASHYFWTAIELRVLVPDPARGEGFWFANVNRSRSDGLERFRGLAHPRQSAGRGRRGDAGGARDHQEADGTLRNGSLPRLLRSCAHRTRRRRTIATSDAVQPDGTQRVRSPVSFDRRDGQTHGRRRSLADAHHFRSQSPRGRTRCPADTSRRTRAPRAGALHSAAARMMDSNR